ncbi:pfs domain-containing protein [Lasiodiplodia theobromae]|nr:pfs domain-containing protein [Lasiodiplodia theobromae]
MGVELAAVKAMLDDTHPALPSTRRDMINYTLGHIGGHNIVIAVLSEIGNNRAAQVAVQLLNDFTQIRFGLLVGIGGGVPSDDNDIRLGDVVVSKPSGEHGGVVQYDMGKFRTSGRFERTGTLKKPPTLLLTTIGNLQAEHLQRGSNVAKLLEEMDRRWPEMRANGFIFPGAEYDQLFEPTYDHPDGPTCQKCSQDQIIDRFPRYDNNPKVFYGTIGSGNAVIKDAKTREKLREDLGVVCVEMEAAGLMDEFQCLVIRGICDYADSHKNKIWQPYAAATAAAYMKELLLALPVKQTEGIPNAEKALHSRELP